MESAGVLKIINWSLATNNMRYTSYPLNEEERRKDLASMKLFYLIINMPPPFERFFDTDQYLTKDHALKI